MDDLPDAIGSAAAGLFGALPLSAAMNRLVVTRGGDEQAVQLADQVVQQPVIAGRPALVAAVWLYVDELDASHRVSQGIDDATGSFWHGIMHRREGDFSNSHYWFRRVGDHPAMAMIDGYDGHRFIDEVQAAHGRGEDPPKLVEMQRREWATLFIFCAGQG